MAIDIVPATGAGAEYEAALTLKQWFRAFATEDDNITIVVGAKLEGEAVEDIDLLVIGDFAHGRILPDQSLPEELRGRQVEIRDFLFTIEVKAHDPANVRLVKGNNIEVRYKGWKNATDQANKQKYAVKNWVEQRLKIGCPRVSHAVWLTNVSKAAFEAPPRHVLFADSDLTDLFAVLNPSMFERALQGEGSAAITAIVGRDRGNIKQLRAYFQNEIELGVLDRRKLERITERIVREQDYVEKLGAQLLVFRGRGGAGKTLRLLNLMTYLCRERDAKVLFLTYNKALVQDIRRLNNVLGLPDRRAHIQTTDSFVMGLCKAIGLAPARVGTDLDWADFASKKSEAARLLGAMGAEAVRESDVSKANGDIFGWDFVLIDEGQDWPAAEKSIVMSVFGHHRLVVADGVDQFVQGANHTDWTSSVPTAERQIVHLHKSLRLKANLCRFAMGFASEMGLHDWSMDLDKDLPGGTVKLFLRPYTQQDHALIFERHQRAGNAAIDSLFCVSTARNNAHRNFPATLKSWGEAVWDGTVDQNRNHFPTDLNQNRVVQYRSCRGLEGWTVVCLDLDCFFDEQVRHAPRSDSPDLLIDAAAQAKRHAARWCLIPFTRAIDTLVVHASEGSELGQVLVRVSRAYPDFVEIVR